MFDHGLWQQMRSRYNADSPFPTNYDKVKPEIDPLQFLEQERGWRDEGASAPSGKPDARLERTPLIDELAVAKDVEAGKPADAVAFPGMIEDEVTDL